MDPTAALDEMLEAYRIGDAEMAHEYARSLMNWLDNGGFAPTIKTAEKCKQVARLACFAVLATSSYEGD